MRYLGAAEYDPLLAIEWSIECIDDPIDRLEFLEAWRAGDVHDAYSDFVDWAREERASVRKRALAAFRKAVVDRLQKLARRIMRFGQRLLVGRCPYSGMGPREYPRFDGDIVMRTWLIVVEPNHVPEMKDPGAEGLERMLRTLIEIRPVGTRITIVELAYGGDLWVQDGHAWLSELAAEQALDASDEAEHWS